MKPGRPRAWRMPAPVANWAAEHSPSERRVAAALAIVIATAAAWVLLWQPMARDTAALRVARAANAAALVEARAMTKEMGAPARLGATGAPADARADLERVLAQQNLRSSVTSLDWRDGRAHIVLAAVGYDALMVALDALQQDARLRAVEATLTARVDRGTVRAELTLAR